VKQGAGVSWTVRRASLLQRACNCVAEQRQTGVRIGRAIRIAAGKFRGRSLGKPHRLKLSEKTLQRLWYESKGGRDHDRFQLHYKPGRASDVDPTFLRLVAESCVSKGVSVAAAIRDLSKSHKIVASLHTIYRKLPMKEIARFAVLTRQSLRNQARLERRRSELLKSICYDDMNASRKPRIQGTISKLPQEQREQIHHWIRENLNYSEISARILANFGVRVSTGSLCNYYQARGGEIFGLAPTETPQRNHE
jgi:hypothetical protein